MKMLPNVEWWIKSDGCDAVSGLTESVNYERSGDVDLGDGRVQKQHADYLKHIELVNGLSHQKQQRIDILHAIKQSLQKDLQYLPGGMRWYMYVIHVYDCWSVYSHRFI